MNGHSALPHRHAVASLVIALAALPTGVAIRSAVAADPSADPPSVVPASPLQLFNGTNLDGFHTWLVDTRREDPRGVFSVTTNGLLRISGDGLGYLATRQAFRDYLLVVEFCWGTTNTRWGDRLGKARDSGLFLHALGPDGNSHDGNGAFMAAIECQIMEGAIGDFLLIRGTALDGTLIAPQLAGAVADWPDADGWPYWKEGGKSRTLVRWGRQNRSGKSHDWRDEFGFHDRARESPGREWNRLECRCAGQRVVVTLNGVKVNEATAVSPSHGRILLQCEGSEIFFRRVDLFPLAN